jgi:hypothetical protein
MKKLLFVLIVGMFVGCATTTQLYNGKPGESIFLDPNNSWVNRGNSVFQSITLTIVNNRKCDSIIYVSCRFNTGDLFENSKVFGDRQMHIDAKSKKVFVVRGFANGGDLITCSLVP